METNAPEQKADEQPKPNALLISVELAESLVKYLTGNPMAEVEGLVNAIRQSRAVTVTDESEKEE